MTKIDNSSIPTKGHGQVLGEHLFLGGKSVLDVGCGAGRLTRIMTQMGATVIGIDPGIRQLERARSQPVIGSETYIEGTAENLPAEDNSTNIIVFFNSLHHVPINQFGNALNEAYRALKGSGMLYIAEPMAQGPQFELSKPFNDETKIRSEAYKAIKGALKNGFLEQKELMYAADVYYSDFDAYRENSTAINPARDHYFRKMEGELRKRFEHYGIKGSNGWHFTQFIRVNLLKAK